MVTYLCNSFSLGMINHPNSTLYVWEVNIYNVKTLLKKGFTSAVGHQATAEVITKLTGIEIPVNRSNISLERGDVVVVFQLGTRLPEGKVLSSSELETLPHKWYLVRVEE